MDHWSYIRGRVRNGELVKIKQENTGGITDYS